jgi:hypothetical protein
MLACPPQTADHLARLEHTATRPAAAVLGGEDAPEVLATAKRRRAVLCADLENLFAALRVHAEHRRWEAVRADDQIADP